MPSWKSHFGGRISPAVIASYVVDWIVIIACAAIGTGLGYVSPNKRPFNLYDADLSFPNQKDTVSVGVLIVISLAVPAVFIFLISMLLVPGPTVSTSIPKSLVWKRKLWEWNTGWLGLALSCALAWFITNGVKNLVGRPRPDMLARCVPAVDRLTDFLVGGYVSPSATGQLVSAGICTSSDSSDVDDAFRSFPSGHSSFSAAGLVYLSLYLASKFAIHFPYLPPKAFSQDSSYLTAFPSRAETSKQPTHETYERPSGHDDEIIAARNQAAAPPVYLLMIALIPTFASIYVCASRFYDFKHHAFDIITGFSIGLLCAFGAFYYYHLPISRGAGWAWGPRSPQRAFWAGVGVGSYAGHHPTVRRRDLEAGTSHTEGDPLAEYRDSS